jgi:hypothetical protein
MSIDEKNAEALTTRKTVTVACKLPHGVVIRDFQEGVMHENVMGGGTRKVKVFRAVGQRIRIKGPQVPTPFLRLVEVVGGYAITDGVDANVFARWMSWNKENPAVVGHLIFGSEDRDSVVGMAKEMAKIKSGLEPLDVTMIQKEGRWVYQDERITRSGADAVMDNKVDQASLTLA